MKTMEVGILGATGIVGQQFVAQLKDHPWFKLVWVGASQRSKGRRYADATSWKLASPIPSEVGGLRVEAATPGNAPRLVFSALDASVAGDIEEAFAESDHLVVSNARNHRMTPNVPLLIPEVNPDHLSLLKSQRAQGRTGAIVTNPNCSTVILVMALAPLKKFGIQKVLVTTSQAVSGAGYPGTPSLDILGNIIPFIEGEEEKMEAESKKILGEAMDNLVKPHDLIVSAQTTRAPVIDGHTAMISIEFETPPETKEILDALVKFSGKPQAMGLPTAPPQPIVYLDDECRPQPRLDADRGRGMTVSIGRLRPCPVLHHKFIALGHNTIRGAAGAAILNGELMAATGLLD